MGRLKFLGPGFILSASIVGSGELIATTTLGAKAGFTAFWIIIVSCLVKVALQIEFGKHAIITGESPMNSFNKLPGLRLKKASWAIWSVFFLILLKVVQVGGMLGGCAIVLHMLFPAISISIWATVAALLSSLLIFKGYYKPIEKSSLVMIVCFTIMTLVSLFSLFSTPYSFSYNDLLSGLKFSLPPELVGLAIGAFGITGIGSDEIIAYNYWCLEKGYAAYTGPRTEDAAWKTRAKGWIQVMYLDAIVSMIIYTAVTAAFYLLGAAILHKQGLAPEGNEVIETLALIYTQSLGNGVRIAYLAGAFFVLFSSVFATLAFWSRLFPDIFGQLQWIDFYNSSTRKKTIAFLSWTIPLIWLLMFLFISLPVFMILSGGVVGSVLLLIIIFAALHFRYKKFSDFKGGVVYNILFWISVLSILFIAVYGIVKLFFLL
jgi:manganese transport protein